MTNTRAVIGGVLTGTVKENEVLSASGQLTIEDVDGEREFMPFSGYVGARGTLSMTKDGAWTYQTFNDIESLQEGSPVIDEFSIAAKDGTLATIAITAYGTNDAPVLASHGTSFQFYEDKVRTGEITGASDRDRDPLSYGLSTGPAHGAVTLTGATYSYTPNLDYVGQDSFVIEITDGHGGSILYTVGVELLRVDDAPVGENNTVTIDHGDSYVIKLDDFGFSDPRDAQWGSGNNLESVQLNSGSVNGPGKLLYDGAEMTPLGTYWILKADIEAGKLVWQSDSGATGKVEIGFYLEDDGESGGVGGDKNTSDAYTLTINSVEINDAPSFTAGADQTAIEDSGSHVIANWATLISAGPSNESAQTLSFDVGNDNAALFEEGPSISADGTLTYKLAANAFGSAAVSVTLKDNGSDEGDNDNSSAPVTFTITVEGVDDAPIISLSSNVIAENSAAGKTIGALSGFDVDGGDFVSFALGSNPGKMFKIVDGDLVVNKNARFNFETQSAYAVDILATDDQGTTVAQTFTIDVTDVLENPRGTRGNDRLVGDAMDNRMNGKGGNDRLTGNAGADTFVFGKAYGRDVIQDFDLAQGDVIDLSRAVGIKSFADLEAHHASVAGGHVRITADDGSVLTIKHIDLTEMATEMFHF